MSTISAISNHIKSLVEFTIILIHIALDRSQCNKQPIRLSCMQHGEAS